jgi:FHA domain
MEKTMIPVQVTLQFMREGNKETRWVRLAMEDTVATTITKLIADLGLAVEDVRGRPMLYQLVLQRRILDLTKPLHEEGVAEGNILQLIPVDANATVGLNVGQLLAGSLLDRLGGRGSGEPLPISAAFANTAGRVVYQLKRTRALVGRADPDHGFPPESLDADLTDMDTRRTVSRPHALIVFADNEFTIRDLYSQHGLMVNGIRLAPNLTHILQSGDVVKFGDVELKFHREP